MLFVRSLQGEKQAEEEEAQPVLTQNGSPRPNRVDFANQPCPEVYDVRLQRKENEGFGFVILTSKNKPPPGGKCRVLVAPPLPGLAGASPGISLPVQCRCFPHGHLSLTLAQPSQLSLGLSCFIFVLFFTQL